MTRFREWVQKQLNELVRPELDASVARLQASVSDSIVGFQQHAVREHQQTRTAITDTIVRMQSQLERDAGAQQAQLRELLHELVDAIGAQPQAPSTVVGGWITSAPVAGAHPGPTEIDLTGGIRLGMRVDARSHFDETWFEGLEVTEVVPEKSGERYRLTRVSDGRPLPMLFDAVDLRPAAADARIAPSQ